MRRVLRWVAWSLGVLLAAFVVATLATMRSGDARLYPPPPGAARVDVQIVTNFYHSSLVVPREALAEAARRRSLPALAAVTAHFARYDRLEFGWGDEGFYTRVPTSAELTTALALRALFRPGNPSVLHVVGFSEPPRIAYPTATMAALTLSETGFDRLATMLDATFARKGRDASLEETGRGLYGHSLFYRAVGTFNVLRVCNHWIADLLAAAGVPTAPVLATMPQGLLWDLTWRAGAAPLPPPPGKS
ncbi:MAG: DUF2459 domain-containing protein [Xanthobacteraceae bacterium]|nr:DUF2459 domain-containing protein [Xanthobacteraceae bacterium]